MRNLLTDYERSNLVAQHKKERDKRVCDRIKAVLLDDKGWTRMQIAEALLLSDDAIGQHIRDYEEYEQLKRSLTDGETICFMDGVHPTHNTQVTYGWIKTGLRKEIAANSGRSRLNLSGAVDLLSSKLHVQENISGLDPMSVFGQEFASRIRDRFRAVSAPA